LIVFPGEDAVHILIDVGNTRRAILPEWTSDMSAG
jgi:hypothetical protein